MIQENADRMMYALLNIPVECYVIDKLNLLLRVTDILEKRIQ